MKLADAADLNTAGREAIRVRSPGPLPNPGMMKWQPCGAQTTVRATSWGFKSLFPDQNLREWRNGSRGRFRICWAKARGGSSPSSRTISKRRLRHCVKEGQGAAGYPESVTGRWHRPYLSRQNSGSVIQRLVWGSPKSFTQVRVLVVPPIFLLGTQVVWDLTVNEAVAGSIPALAAK